MADGSLGAKTLTEQQERFCRFILEGKNQTDAYKAAGYKAKDDNVAKANASRLIANANVAAFLAERRAGASRRTELNAAHFAKRLERLAAAAERTAFPDMAPAEMADGQPPEILAVSPKEAAEIARQCSMDAAKLLGQIIDQSRVQSENINYSIGDSPMTEDEWEREFGDADAMGTPARTPARAH